MSIQYHWGRKADRVLSFILVWVVAGTFGGVWAQTGSAAKSNPVATADANSPATNQPALTMSVKVKVVSLLATVRDKHGKIANNLGKDDFTLAEDGRPQSIRYFTKETDLPLTLGLLVDTSLSQRRVLDQEVTASHAFLNEMLRIDKDKAFIIHFDQEVELLQDLTSEPQKLESALDDLHVPELRHSSGGGGSSNPGGGSGHGHGSGGHWGHGAGTLLYDSLYLASDELMSKQQGRKAVVILTDGVDQGSKETLDYAVETAQRADTVVYCILFKDDESYGNSGGGYGGGPWGGHGGGMGRHGGGYPRQEEHPDGKKVLERIARETGGRMFQVSKKEPIDQIYAQISEELRNQYSLGYTPDRAGKDEAAYHKIQLTTKQKDLIVQTRDGYYATQ